MQKNLIKHLCLLTLFVLIAGRGLIEALIRGKMLSGHDTMAYAMFLTQFDENIMTGQLFPIWAAQALYGYGQPILLFRPPVFSYLSEFFFILTGHLFASLNLACMSIIFGAALGMYFLIRKTLDDRDSLFAPLIAGAYILSPYVITDIYVRGAYSELTVFAIFPWLTISCIALARNPNVRNIFYVSISYALLALSHSGIHLIATAAIGFFIVVYRRNIQNYFYFGGAFILGLMMSCFFWLILLWEKNNIKSALFAVDFESYVGHFKSIHEFIFAGASVPMNYRVGVFTLFGLAFALWKWASHPLDRREGSDDGGDPPLLKPLLCLSVFCIYFMHRTSAVWYEVFPWLQALTFPWRFLTLLTFFGVGLGAVALKSLLPSRSHLIPLACGLLAVGGFIFSGPRGFSARKPSEFTTANLSRAGFGFAKETTSPTQVSFLPTQKTDQLVDILSGRITADCKRHSPTSAECKIFVVQRGTLRFNTLDYPGWKTYIDNKPALTSYRDPLFGTLQVNIDHPGEHTVAWKFQATTDRVITQIISGLTFLGMLMVYLISIFKAARSEINLR